MKKGNETICALLDKVMRQQREIDNYKEQIALMERQNSGMLNDYLVKKDKNDFLTKENAELHREVEKLEKENEELKDERAHLQRLCATHEAKIESLEKDCEIFQGKIGELHKRLNTGRGPGRRREMYDLQEELVEAVKGAVEAWYCGEE